MKTSITILLSLNQAQAFFETFKAQKTKTPPYAYWCLKLENCTVTYYQSGKCLFQGPNAEIYANKFQNREKEETIIASYPQAGSDEVGTGDYFGPIVVCAAYVQKEQLEILKKYAVQDSKKIDDLNIKKIANVLSPQFPHSIISLNPSAYNQLHQHYNLNAIKALMHNQAYLNLAKQISLPAFCIVDQFTAEKQYFKYLINEKDVFKNLHFRPKAESYYPCVALASIFARNYFLDEWEKLEKQYAFSFAKGAGKLVDQNSQAFVQKYGFAKLHKVAKIHFKNTSKINN